MTAEYTACRAVAVSSHVLNTRSSRAPAEQSLPACRSCSPAPGARQAGRSSCHRGLQPVYDKPPLPGMRLNGMTWRHAPTSLPAPRAPGRASCAGGSCCLLRRSRLCMNHRTSGRRWAAGQPQHTEAQGGWCQCQALPNRSAEGFPQARTPAQEVTRCAGGQCAEGAVRWQPRWPPELRASRVPRWPQAPQPAAAVVPRSTGSRSSGARSGLLPLGSPAVTASGSATNLCRLLSVHARCDAEAACCYQSCSACPAVPHQPANPPRQPLRVSPNLKRSHRRRARREAARSGGRGGPPTHLTARAWLRPDVKSTADPVGQPAPGCSCRGRLSRGIALRKVEHASMPWRLPAGAQAARWPQPPPPRGSAAPPMLPVCPGAVNACSPAERHVGQRRQPCSRQAGPAPQACMGANGLAKPPAWQQRRGAPPAGLAALVPWRQPPRYQPPRHGGKWTAMGAATGPWQRAARPPRVAALQRAVGGEGWGAAALRLCKGADLTCRGRDAALLGGGTGGAVVCR